MSKNVCCGPSCEFSKGVVCPEDGRSCERCGWNPKEIALRKADIKRGGLKQMENGKKYYPMRKKGDTE